MRTCFSLIHNRDHLLVCIENAIWSVTKHLSSGLPDTSLFQSAWISSCWLELGLALHSLLKSNRYSSFIVLAISYGYLNTVFSQNSNLCSPYGCLYILKEKKNILLPFFSEIILKGCFTINLLPNPVSTFTV